MSGPHLWRVGAVNMVAGAPHVDLVVAGSDAPAKVRATADYACDGTADDVQIQAAIDSVGLLGRAVITLVGTFKLAATVIPRGWCVIQGLGNRVTTVEADTGFLGTFFDFNRTSGFITAGGGTHSGFLTLRNFNIDGPDAGYGHGINLNGYMWDWTIEDMMIRHMGGWGIRAGYGWGGTLRNVIIEDNQCGGIDLWKDDVGGAITPTSFSPTQVYINKSIHNWGPALVVDGNYANIQGGLFSVATAATDPNRFVIMDCNALDCSAWDIGDAVQNKTGAGDDWTGIVAKVRWDGVDDTILVRLAVGKTIANVATGDGIENTTKSESANTLASVLRSASICISGSYATVSGVSVVHSEGETYPPDVAVNVRGALGRYSGMTLANTKWGLQIIGSNNSFRDIAFTSDVGSAATQTITDYSSFYDNVTGIVVKKIGVATISSSDHVSIVCVSDVGSGGLGWVVGNAVRNYNTGGGAAGDNWTGTIRAVDVGGNGNRIIVELATGALAAVDNADGIDNTTQSEQSATLTSHSGAGAIASGLDNNLLSSRTGVMTVSPANANAAALTGWDLIQLAGSNYRPKWVVTNIADATAYKWNVQATIE